MVNSGDLIESLMVFRLNVDFETSTMDVKVTLKDFSVVRIEPVSKNQDDVMSFMNMSMHQRAEITNYITNHLTKVRESLSKC